MAANLPKIIQAIKARAKSTHAWTRGHPITQPYFTYQNGVWQRTDTMTEDTFDCSRFSVLSWNIDFMRILPSERMNCALKYLSDYSRTLTAPSIIMLNEMLVSDLELLQNQKWIQEGYRITDLDDKYWESGYYGTCVLISRMLPISKVFRVHYTDTAMERDALFIDLYVQNKNVRICSTHLESLIANPPKRPSQLAEAAKFMHEADASILGGDLNAIEPFDKRLHIDNDLKDAYLSRGGQEDAECGMTWGQMAPTTLRKQFGLSRMDKLMFHGAVDIVHFETFGMNVMVDDEKLQQQLIEEEGLEEGWVTDHLGVRGDFRLVSKEKQGANL